MIKKIKINKLFGRFNYELATKDGGVTIITGPNGFGKSTILKIVDALSHGQIMYFYNLEFSSIYIFFDNNKNIKIVKDDNSLIFGNIRFKLNDFEMYNTNRRWMYQLSKNVWLDRRNGQKISIEELPFYVYEDEDDIDSVVDREKLTALRDYVSKIKEWSGEVRLISEQRLIRKEDRRNDEEQIVEVISELPEKLKNEINLVSAEYSKVANRLDSSYPKRLFATKDGIKSKDEYEEKLKEANSKFNKLNEYNLVDMTLIEQTKFNAKFSEALKIYFDDFSEKYKVFEELIKKLDIFTQIINERLMFKKIKISRKNGFEVVDSDFPEKKLTLNQLSSGEKQEIVLFYDLIFNTKSELLLLIDEPEISLHITWQKNFLDDLLKVAKDIDLQIILATHSPQIVSSHWDIQIDLGEEYGK